MIVDATDYVFEDADWMAEAACRGVPPEVFFPPMGRNAGKAYNICGRCPVRDDCLGYALRWRIRYGIWGGTTERQRRCLNRTVEPPRLAPHPHGTTKRYAAGCRCDGCTFIHSQYSDWVRQA